MPLWCSARDEAPAGACKRFSNLKISRRGWIHSWARRKKRRRQNSTHSPLPYSLLAFSCIRASNIHWDHLRPHRWLAAGHTPALCLAAATFPTSARVLAYTIEKANKLHDNCFTLARGLTMEKKHTWRCCNRAVNNEFSPQHTEHSRLFARVPGL